MNFSQGQMRQAVGITTETFRHWKRVLPPFSSRSGHSCKFSAGDILAVAILKRLTDTCSINVGKLSGVSNELAYLCNTVSWNELEKLILLVDLESNTCRTTQILEPTHARDVCIVVPLANSVQKLRDDILSLQIESKQGQLALSSTFLNSSKYLDNSNGY